MIEELIKFIDSNKDFARCKIRDCVGFTGNLEVSYEELFQIITKWNMNKIVVNKSAIENRINNTVESVANECQKRAEQGFDTFRMNIKTADSVEKERILEKLEKDYGLKLSHMGCNYNGLDGIFKSWSIKLFV